MSVDLLSTSFSNIGVHDSIVQQTVHNNLAVTKKIPRGRVPTAKSERLEILPRVVT